MLFNIKLHSMVPRLTSPLCIKATKIWALIVLCIGVLVGFVTLLTYFGYGLNKKVYQNEYAVVENSYSMKLRGPLEQGTYNDLTIGDTMVKYRSTIQFIEYGEPTQFISCITRDGLIIRIEVNVQLQFDKNEIIPVVMYLFGTGDVYMDFVNKTIYGLLYADCAKFNANDYYSMRNIIEDVMYRSVTEQYNNKTSGITIYNVQLKNILFPQEFVDIIAAKQHLVQELQTQNNIRTSKLIEANSTLIQAQQQALITTIQAYNTANLTGVNANATVNNIHTKYQKMADYFGNVQTQFGFNVTGLIQYIYVQYAKTGTIFASI